MTARLFSVRAQEVSIPDPGLNAAIRAALQKPAGPLTEQDLLSLTNLTTLLLDGNPLGSVSFTDVGAHLSARKFHRVLLVTSSTNMVFIPPTTFTPKTVLVGDPAFIDP